MGLNIAKNLLEDIIKEKPFLIENQEEYLVEALDIAVKHKITIYDSLFIIQARKKTWN